MRFRISSQEPKIRDDEYLGLSRNFSSDPHKDLGLISLVDHTRFIHAPQYVSVPVRMGQYLATYAALVITHLLGIIHRTTGFDDCFYRKPCRYHRSDAKHGYVNPLLYQNIPQDTTCKDEYV